MVAVDIVAAVDVTSPGGGAPLSPAPQAKGWGQVPCSPLVAVRPAMPAAVYVVTSAQPKAVAAKYETTSAQALVQPRVFVEATRTLWLHLRYTRRLRLVFRGRCLRTLRPL